MSSIEGKNILFVTSMEIAEKGFLQIAQWGCVSYKELHEVSSADNVNETGALGFHKDRVNESRA